MTPISFSAGVSTASAALMDAAQGAAGWEGQVWDRRLRVRQTTLDSLIARHGTPAFMKIDVEGFETEMAAQRERVADGRTAMPAVQPDGALRHAGHDHEHGQHDHHEHCHAHGHAHD